MNNKGFTLTELLAVIIILAVVGSIATVSILALSDDVNEEFFESQKEIILNGAVLYGQDNLTDFNDTCEEEVDGTVVSYSCKIISLGDISADYVERTDECEVCINNDECERVACIKNDITGLSMEEDKIKLIIKNKRVYAEFETFVSCLVDSVSKCE